MTTKTTHLATILLTAVLATEAPADPPWPAQYKIKPSETARLTEADVVGPDGIVYPNWTKCGVQGGIPQVAVAAKIEQFGARADDGRDDSAALARACRSVGLGGGGAILLGKGTYDLDWPVTVRHDGVVIRGQGPTQTKLRFRYALPESGIAFFRLQSGDRIGKQTRVSLHCRPSGLAKMTIEVDGRTVHQWTRGKHSGNTFATGIDGWRLLRRMPDGKHTLRGTADYKDGKSLQVEISVVFDSAFEAAAPMPDWRAAIQFAGAGQAGAPIKLARDGCRGDRTLLLESTAGLTAGDCIHLEAPPTQRWKRLVQNACLWGSYREYAVRIEKIDGNTVWMGQPLRIEFPTIDGSRVRRIAPIRKCGIEDLCLEQTENLWITSVLMSHAWNCWARNVRVNRCGRHPVYAGNAKWCEIRDCVFDDAWFKGGGGTAYGGWQKSWDCLMEDVETFRLRHAPLFQWAASGNVIRKSVFHDSDAQWHAGWTHENLIEQCVVKSVRGNGGYGFGMWASPPQDKAHGPNGPRNVVYNCDVRSAKAGLWMGGMNENWLILHNRFRVATGNGVEAQTASFDHIIRGNVFVLENPKASMVYLKTPDCTGVEIVDNQLFGGNGQFVSGPVKPALVKGNRSNPPGDPPRPRPAVPSIYQWQQEQATK